MTPGGPPDVAVDDAVDVAVDVTVDVAVVGGGPVGLFLGCALAARGLSVRVLEQSPALHRHSRAIGVHPPALERLNELGLAEAMIREGVAIRRGRAFAGQRALGQLSFASCPPPYPFVLALPQHRTEALLAARLFELAPGALELGAALEALLEDETGVTLHVAGGGTLRASYVVGCDGKHSRVRQQAGFAVTERGYPDRYVMGDFDEHTELGTDAGIYLCREGLVESFPLPGGTRRWVVGTAVPVAAPDQLSAVILERLGHAPDPDTATMLSAFGVEARLAAPLARGRVLLAGDAAHVVSPIGGQGMNLGWLGAWDAAATLARIRTGAPSAPELAGYAERRRRAALRARARAEWNMRLGRAGPAPQIKHLAVRAMLSPTFSSTFARAFTMRGLS